MRVKVLLQIIADEGTAGDAAEVAVFEKQTERPEDLGLSIAEGKALMAAVQQRVVDTQAVRGRNGNAVARRVVRAGTARAATLSSS
jgi:hypothetical protein